MGCDIHIYVEQQKDGKWVAVEGANPWYGKFEDEPENRLANWIYNNRNYDVFAVLANVRNMYGFNSISVPKGLPQDVSPEISQESDEWGCDGHSHSWLTLKELLDYNWQQVTKHHGWVDEEEYRQFKQSGKPVLWCGSVVGSNVVHVDNNTMDAILAGKVARIKGYSYYTQVEWQETYAESCRDFLEGIIPKLQALDTNPENVRIVFWFDN